MQLCNASSSKLYSSLHMKGNRLAKSDRNAQMKLRPGMNGAMNGFGRIVYASELLREDQVFWDRDEVVIWPCKLRVMMKRRLRVSREARRS